MADALSTAAAPTPAAPAARGGLLILGLGNLLCGDDGLGVAAVERLARRYRMPDGVRALDGGTLGLSLLPCFEGAADVILVDAVLADGPAGTAVRLEGEAVAPAARNRLSCHQVGVSDLLDGLRWLDAYPRRLVLLGLVPETLELGLGHSPAVERQLPGLVERIVREAAAMGYDLPTEEHDESARGGSPAARALGL